MKITSLGHGGAFAGFDKGNTAFLFESGADVSGGARKFLFDCGGLTPYILRDEMKIDLHSIDGVYISHAHGDHFAGLLMFLQSRYWVPNPNTPGRKVAPRMYAHDNVWWEIRSTLDTEVRHFKDGKYYGLKDFIWSGLDRPDESGFNFGPWIFNYKKQSHIAYSSNTEKPVYGLELFYGGKKILFTSDTGSVADLGAYDIVFHDCEISDFKSGVHAHWTDILAAWEKLDIDKRPKMYLTHYTNARPNDVPSEWVWFEKGSSITI